MSRWFRWYEGTTEDAKFRLVARLSRVTIRDVIALWAFILEDAAHLDHRGVCQRNEDFMAATLDFDDGVVERILSAMEDANLVSVGHGAITVCNFGKRQFESDADPTASERQRRKRERDREVINGQVTRDSRPPDTDTDTDTKKKDGERASARPPKRSISLPKDFEPDWSAATSLGFTQVEAAREFEKFKNYAALKGRTCLDWQAAWRNWCIKAAEFVNKQPPKPGGPKMATLRAGQPGWDQWKAHYRDTGQNNKAAQMDRFASEGKEMTFPTEQPPRAA